MDRINDLIQRELSLIIMQEMRDPRVGIVTLSHVQVSKDMAHAKILISLVDETLAPDTLRALNKAAGFLRTALSKKMHTRIVPQLAFYFDANGLAAQRLTRLIDSVCANENNNNV